MGNLCLSPVGTYPFPRRCRRCKACRRQDAWEWTKRCEIEALRVPRVYFGTLTFRPRGAKWVPTDANTWADAKRHLEALRKAGAFRYFGAPEFGDKRGRHHYHFLYFVPEESPIRIRHIQSRWKQGFNTVRKAHHDDYGYVADYAAKQGGRKRASTLFGDVKHIAAHPLVEKVLREFPGSEVTRVAGIHVPHSKRKLTRQKKDPAHETALAEFQAKYVQRRSGISIDPDRSD